MSIFWSEMEHLIAGCLAALMQMEELTHGMRMDILMMRTLQLD